MFHARAAGGVAPPDIHSVSQVTATRRSREEEETPTVTLSARVAVGASADVRVTARPVVATMADALAVPRLEIHTTDGTSVTLEGPPLSNLVKDALSFLRGGLSESSSCEHDHVYGLRATFDLSTGPFTVLEQPPFEVAHATTHAHPSGNVALRLRGIDRTRKREEFHAPLPLDGPPEVRPSFELQLTAKRASWLAAILEEAAVGLDRTPEVPR